MTVFSGKGKYWLIMVTLLVIISLVWQLISADEHSDFSRRTEIIHNVSNEQLEGNLNASAGDSDKFIESDSNSGATVDADNSNDESSSGSSNSKNTPSNQENKESADNNDEEKFPVYLVGAVENPGIYQIWPGMYLYQLVDMAGGMAITAATDQINLAARIYHNQLIRIPTKEDMIQNPDMQYISEEKPSIENQGSDSNSKNDQTDLININTADSHELEKLPGIGSATAQAIINYRQISGKFSRIEDIMKVSGIKESRFEAIMDLITVK